jgi:hypothetical protein
MAPGLRHAFALLTVTLVACATSDASEEGTEFAEPQLVYGADDIRPIALAPAAIQARAAAVGIMFNDIAAGSGLRTRADGRTLLETVPLSSLHDLCAPARRQVGWWPLPARSLFGTSFLVAPNVVATNAHVADVGPIADHRVIFTWAASREGISRRLFDRDEIYRTTRIRFRDAEADWALVELDRPVVIGGRPVQPLAVASRPPRAGTRLTMVGHPLGTTKKFTTGSVRHVDGLPDWFESDLDAHEGASGSPVFDSSGVVVGLIWAVQGESDFTKTAEGCEVLSTCTTDGESCGGFAGHIPTARFVDELRKVGATVTP